MIAPAYPGFEVEALRADPTPIAEVTAPGIVDQYASVIRELHSPPIIIGHAAGGAFTQVLLDHGFGAAGVALCSAPTEGVRSVDAVGVPVLKNPANHHKAVPIEYAQWNYAFTNAVSSRNP